MINLQNTFFETAKTYSTDLVLIKNFGEEIESLYSSQDRYYHNLFHLQNMLVELTPLKEQIGNWDTIIFSTFYHDSIYDVKMNDNEERSALLAESRLKELNFSDINNCVAQILATKGHQKTEDNGINFFVDADLSILGQEWDRYFEYCKQVRKEYEIYPDSIYNEGRKKVLNSFLQMNKIYKTPYFSEKYESKARFNVMKEIDLL